MSLTAACYTETSSLAELPNALTDLLRWKRPDEMYDTLRHGRCLSAAGLEERQHVIVCLPLIGPIGSRRLPQVFVMKPTDAWHCHHPALARWLHTPRLRRVLRQR